MIDIRHAPSANDKTMYEWIVKHGFSPILIATKLDKLKRSQVAGQVKLIRQTLKVRPETVLIPFSAQTRQGRDEIYALLDSFLEQERGGPNETIG